MVTRYRAMVLGLCAGMISATAMAEDESVPAGAGGTAFSAAGGPGSTSRMRIGFNLVPMPFGTYTVGTGTLSASGDLKVAFGVLPFFDYRLTPNIFVGFGPTFAFNVLAKNASGDASKQLDLLVRVGGEVPVADTVQLYGYLAPGYSMIMPSKGDDPTGFVLGVHVGAMISLSPTGFLNGELGYQVGFQSVTVASISIDSKDNLMQISFGGGLRL